MVSISYYLDRPKAKKTAVMVRVFPGDVRCSTGISVNPENWLGEEPYVSKKQHRSEYIRKTLKEYDGSLFKECTRLLEEGENYDKFILQQIMRPNNNPVVRKGRAQTIKDYYEQWFWEYLDKHNKNNPVYGAWKEAYLKRAAIKTEERKKIFLTNTKKINNYTAAVSKRQVVMWLEKFRPNIRARDINPDSLQAYYDFLAEEADLEDNTLIKHQNFLRKALQAASLPYEWIEVNKATETHEPDLYWPEVLALRDTVYKPAVLSYTSAEGIIKTRKATAAEIQQAAITFVINCQLCLRWSDLSTLEPVNYVPVVSQKYGDITMIVKRQEKTRFDVKVPIPPMAVALMTQYGGIPLPAGLNGNQRLDLYAKLLKEAARQAGLNRMVLDKIIKQDKDYSVLRPLHELIRPHHVRQTGASRMYEATNNEALKERLLGHKRKNDTYTKVRIEVLGTALLDGWNLIEGNK